MRNFLGKTLLRSSRTSLPASTAPRTAPHLLLHAITALYPRCVFALLALRYSPTSDLLVCGLANGGIVGYNGVCADGVVWLVTRVLRCIDRDVCSQDGERVITLDGAHGASGIYAISFSADGSQVLRGRRPWLGLWHCMEAHLPLCCATLPVLHQQRQQAVQAVEHRIQGVCGYVHAGQDT